MSDIQKARDVLAKWRNDGSSDPWRRQADGVPGYEIGWDILSPTHGEIGFTNGSRDARLIVGTAGNPDLLDAIDGLLGGVQQMEAQIVMSGWAGMVEAAERIAAAIIAADERMSA